MLGLCLICCMARVWQPHGMVVLIPCDHTMVPAFMTTHPARNNCMVLNVLSEGGLKIEGYLIYIETIGLQ